jgi:hypothetical protein
MCIGGGWIRLQCSAAAGVRRRRHPRPLRERRCRCRRTVAIAAFEVAASPRFVPPPVGATSMKPHVSSENPLGGRNLHPEKCAVSTSVGSKGAVLSAAVTANLARAEAVPTEEASVVAVGAAAAAAAGIAATPRSPRASMDTFVPVPTSVSVLLTFFVARRRCSAAASGAARLVVPFYSEEIVEAPASVWLWLASSLRWTYREQSGSCVLLGTSARA